MSKTRRKTRIGQVVSDKADKTVIVAVAWQQQHRLYHKSIRRKSKFHVHDENNSCRLGDQVQIMETRPLSRTKRWRVVEILARREVPEIQPREIDASLEKELAPAATGVVTGEAIEDIVAPATESQVAEEVAEVVEATEETEATQPTDEVTEATQEAQAPQPTAEVTEATQETEAPQPTAEVTEATQETGAPQPTAEVEVATEETEAPQPTDGVTEATEETVTDVQDDRKKKTPKARAKPTGKAKESDTDSQDEEPEK